MDSDFFDAYLWADATGRSFSAEAPHVRALDIGVGYRNGAEFLASGSSSIEFVQE